ncbi:Ubiquitin carboxyl-terminal hydrolase [Paramyrothecium foliicola]|nr:Ubiquitin carboxyl-terminal hydrolase [Paramyrothecium foliicola]
MAANHRYGLPSGSDGRNGGASGPGKPPLPHIDDLLAVPDDVDSNTSIKRLLDIAGTSLRQAEMLHDFNKPAQALKEYIRASIIAIQFISGHKDYPAMKSLPGELGKTHAALLKRITQQNDAFSKIKQDIVADNKRSGVRPTVQRPNSNRSNAVPNNAPAYSQQTSTTAQDGTRRKPAVQPKPSTMQGNALKVGHGRNASTGNAAQDSLFSRFATLRGPQSVPGQDPRIKTHTIVPPDTMKAPSVAPKGPREMPPPPQRQNSDLHGPVPTLPKMPDAIYSPARGSISGESTRQPPSTPRGSYSRTGSSTSLSSIATMSYQQQKSDYFAPMQAVGEKPDSVPSPKIPQGIADAASVTAEELYELIKSKASLLVIDVRSREDFEAGHIWTQNTICVEPTVLDRGDLSASQIGESLCLSSSKEQLAFEERSKFDIVVFHDEDSEMVPNFPNNEAELALIRLQRALTDFDYDASKLKNTPKLLRGGIRAWTDLMGPASVQSTHPTEKMPSLSSHASTDLRQRRKSSYTVKLDSEEAKKWQEIVKQDSIDTASTPGYVRSKEDFLRRYPPVIMEQESMTGPSNVNRTPRYGSSHADDLRSELPTPPSRPPPAVPRPSYSGVSQSSIDADTYDETGVTQSPRIPTRSKPAEQASSDLPRVYTGLDNPGNWCYANSLLQALLVSPGFGRELADSSWQESHKVPRTKTEKMDNPQLMMKIMSNLFHWMSTGKFHSMKAQTLMDYSRHIRKQNGGTPLFGGPDQQDASEFLLFLLANLDEETNTRRNIEDKPSQPDTTRLTLAQAADEYWRSHLNSSYSIIDRFWRGLELSTVCCQRCQTKTYRFAALDTVILYLSHNEMATTLATSLNRYAAQEVVEDFQCDNCNGRTRALRHFCFARMPRLLCVVLSRAGHRGKTSCRVTWDLNDFDFAPWYFRTGDGTGQQPNSSSLRYECYAVVVHQGLEMTSGHYYTFVRDANSHGAPSWLKCNDTSVTKVRNINAALDNLDDRNTPFLLFFRRK